jgi:uncharacterized membrane protein (UPF0136 family)
VARGILPATEYFEHEPNQRQMNDHLVLWVYTVLLVVGGLIGLLKGGSKISLATAVAFAIPLILCNLGVIPFSYSTWLLIALLVVFAWRLSRTKKFMPAGLLLLLTIFALALPRIFK